MTTAPHASAGSSVASAHARTPLVAALTAAAAVVLMAVGYADLTGNSSSDPGLRELLVVAGIIAAATAGVFGLVVRTAASGDPARRSAVLGVLAVVAILVFWSGLPTVLAGGAVGCALAARDRVGRLPRTASAGLVLAGVALAAAVVCAVVG